MEGVPPVAVSSLLGVRLQKDERFITKEPLIYKITITLLSILLSLMGLMWVAVGIGVVILNLLKEVN